LKRKHKSSAAKRPLVGLCADGSSRYGRDIARGVMRYANAHRQWEVYSVLRHLGQDWTGQWPACEGAILGGASREAFSLICRTTPHVIACSGSVDPERMPTVCLDDWAVGVTAARHLLECGLKNFSFYGVPHRAASNNREGGFKSTIESHGGSCFQCSFEFPGWTDPKEAQPWVELVEWLKQLPKPIGIMAVDDAGAAYLASACSLANLSVPEQVAIIGVNNDEIVCELASTPISSVEAGFHRIGYAAALLLDRLIKGESVSHPEQHQRFAPLGIVKRLSTDLFAIDDAQLADVIRYIREHACDPCSVADVADIAAIGRRNLERRFLQKLGRSPGEEILGVQMETAKRLLLQPELSVSVVAARSGFSGVAPFSRAFHRVTELTPSEYRRSILKSYQA
jgi:LacI family transcriptional regulator